jgi:hypothetical protein
MKRRGRYLPPITRAGLGATLVALLSVVIVGCSSPAGPKPGRTKLTSRLIEVPVEIVGNLIVVETNWDGEGPWRFLVDTGSSVTLIDPQFAARHAVPGTVGGTPEIRVRDATGALTMLEPATIARLEFGDARFDRVKALIYDCHELSAHLGRTVHGVIGFPLFRDTILTLDYPNSRLLLTPAGEAPLVPGSTIHFDTESPLPLIPIEVADRTLLALIDSGSDGPLNLNPAGLDLTYTTTPRPGATINALVSDRVQEVGRLASDLRIGAYVLPRPVVDLTDELSSLGGEVLRHFVLTFDQARGTVTFYRPTSAPVITPARRSAGLSFAKSPAYWRVAGVVPGSPAELAGIEVGDLVVRIDGAAVAVWDLQRYRDQIQTAPKIAFTFLHGDYETTIDVPIFDLVP